jgi:transcriptional regulator with XRE-family HTH domain
MPATMKTLDDAVLRQRVAELARRVRQRRKVLGVTVVAAAEAAGMSRVTWHRIEKGEVSVTIGAWFNALAVLGLRFGLGETTIGAAGEGDAGEGDEVACVPVEIRVQDFPQLQALAWQVAGGATLRPREALDIYQRHRRHIDWTSMPPGERRLVNALMELFGEPRSV